MSGNNRSCWVMLKSAILWFSSKNTKASFFALNMGHFYLASELP